MESCVLFSPVGMTDPMANYHDGAMLHIARRYRPSKIYLYMSKEAAAFQERDDRYRRAVKLLGDSLDVDFIVEEISRPELVDVHLFDEFYDEFEEIIGRIKRENPGAVVLLNVSSGTPAMKSALHTIAAMTDDADCVPIQVSTPEKGHNPHNDDIADYDVQTQWDCNEDCKRDFTDRTSCSKNYKLILKIKKEILQRHIDAYDYHAALSVAEEIARALPREAAAYIEAAFARVQLDMRKVDSLIATGSEARLCFAPVSDSNRRSLAEYLLWLDLKIKRKEYGDFLRAISPLFLDLLVKILEKNGVRIDDYCSKAGKKLTLRRSRLESSEKGMEMLSILDPLFGGFRDGSLGSAQLAPLAMYYVKDAEIKKQIEKLRGCEEKCRNIAAHEIVGVTEEWIRDNCGMTPKDILDILTGLSDHAGIPRTKIKDSYEKMNEFIKQTVIM